MTRSIVEDLEKLHLGLGLQSCNKTWWALMKKNFQFLIDSVWEIPAWVPCFRKYWGHNYFVPFPVCWRKWRILNPVSWENAGGAPGWSFRKCFLRAHYVQGCMLNWRPCLHSASRAVRGTARKQIHRVHSRREQWGWDGQRKRPSERLEEEAALVRVP